MCRKGGIERRSDVARPDVDAGHRVVGGPKLGRLTVHLHRPAVDECIRDHDVPVALRLDLDLDSVRFGLRDGSDVPRST